MCIQTYASQYFEALLRNYKFFCINPSQEPRKKYNLDLRESRFPSERTTHLLGTAKAWELRNRHQEFCNHIKYGLITSRISSHMLCLSLAIGHSAWKARSACVTDDGNSCRAFGRQRQSWQIEFQPLRKKERSKTSLTQFSVWRDCWKSSSTTASLRRHNQRYSIRT